jgi:hypothetical protein
MRVRTFYNDVLTEAFISGQVMAFEKKLTLDELERTEELPYINVRFWHSNGVTERNNGKH